jgi:hypothetical protein
MLAGGSGEQSEAAQPSGNRVLVKSPDGTVGTLPEEQLEEALASGYSRAE